MNTYSGMFFFATTLLIFFAISQLSKLYHRKRISKRMVVIWVVVIAGMHTGMVHLLK